MILVDTSAILAAYAVDEPRHAECARALTDAPGPLMLSPFVLAEADYMIQKFAGTDRELEFLEEVSRGVYELPPLDSVDIDFARQIMSRYRELEIGLTDASIVVLAARYDCWNVLTLDERHFRALRVPGYRRPFRILPADA